MNTMVKGLRYTKRDRAAWHNDFQQPAKVASHLCEPSARLDVLLPSAVYILACERILMARKEHGIYSA